MARPGAWPALLLAVIGALLVLGGIASLAAGLWLGEWIYAQFPPDNNTDAAAVGGAAFALGIGALFLAFVHLGMGLYLWRSAPRALVPGIVLCAAMAVVAFAWAAAALVTAASGVVPAGMVPAGIGLVLVAGGYAWAAVALIGLRRRSRGPT
jgi:hypothetical protein